jgi:glycine cleavage system H protein
MGSNRGASAGAGPQGRATGGWFIKAPVARKASIARPALVGGGRGAGRRQSAEIPPAGGRGVSKTPEGLLYSKSHEWVRIEGDEATIGITDHAQEALNDIVYVELPKVGAEFDQEAEFGVVESVKSVSDLYMPVAGRVTAVNTELEERPETLNEDPYGKGWLVRVRLRDPAQARSLLSAQDYAASVA